jgi:integrase
MIGPLATDTVDALIDAYIAAWPTLPKKLAVSTQYTYRRNLDIARKAWGALSAKGLRPVHVRALMETLANMPGKANAFLGAMRAFSAWALVHGHIETSLIEGVKSFDRSDKGHKPWTPGQIRAAHEKLTGMVRRGVMLALYTGQRGSDVVRLGPTDIDTGHAGDGFRLRQKKTGSEPWCPILPELAAEIATWEKRPGPFVIQPNGKPLSWKHFWKFFDAARANIPELTGTTLHGLRANAVINLRQLGLSAGQISDAIGMSLQMVERYCRFADRKAGGQAVLLKLQERSKNRIVKQ